MEKMEPGTHQPDNWVLLRVDNTEGVFYNILSGWSGGYTTGDSWRLSSRVTEITDNGNCYTIYTESGSVYTCGKNAYCLRMNNVHIWEQLKRVHGDVVSMVDEEKLLAEVYG